MEPSKLVKTESLRNVNESIAQLTTLCKRTESSPKRAKFSIEKKKSVENSRERKRIKDISNGFQKLKSLIPWIPKDTKLSKIHTLRLAILYIDVLTKTLNNDKTGAKELFNQNVQKWPWLEKAFELHSGPTIASEFSSTV